MPVRLLPECSLALLVLSLLALLVLSLRLLPECSLALLVLSLLALLVLSLFALY